jgi:hypothetical protein
MPPAPSGRPLVPPAPLCLLVLALLALGTARAVLGALPALQLPAPVAPVVAAAGAGSTPPRRVLVVVIDGLRADVAAELPFLRTLAAAGARVEVAAEIPTYSAAQYVAMLTGVPPADSGVRTNIPLARTPLATVPGALRAAGRRAVEVGDEVDWWARLFGDDFAVARVAPPERLVAEVRALVPGADLMLVHQCGVDAAGHQHGAASAAYRAAAAHADETTRRLATAWGWPAADVLVLADHGHRAAGGHGGDEPEVRASWLVAAGPGIQAGARVPPGRMIDVAPTLAALLGVPAPGGAQGRTLLEALAIPGSTRAALAAADRARIAAASEAALAARAPLLRAEARQRRLRLALLVACLALAALALRRRPAAAARGLLCGALVLALTAAAFALRHGPLSLSAARTAQLLGFSVGVLALGASVLPFLPAYLAALRRRRQAVDSAAFALAAAIGAGPAAAFAFVQAGAFAPRLTCEPAWFAALPLVAYAAFTPPVFAAALLAALAAALELRARRAPPALAGAVAHRLP